MKTSNIKDSELPYYNEACATCGIPADMHNSHDSPTIEGAYHISHKRWGDLTRCWDFKRSYKPAYGVAWWLGTKPQAAVWPGKGYWWIKQASASYKPASDNQSIDGGNSWHFPIEYCWLICHCESDEPYDYIDIFGTDEGLRWEREWDVIVEVGPQIIEPEL